MGLEIKEQALYPAPSFTQFLSQVRPCHAGLPGDCALRLTNATDLDFCHRPFPTPHK
jgi:hypothetical protein